MGQLLLAKLRKGTINAEELVLLETWYNHFAESAGPYDDLEGYVQNMKSMDAAFPFEMRSKKKNLWPRYAAAAAAIILVLSGIYFFSGNHGVSKALHYTGDIAPGKSGATLTLSDGKKIRLSDADSGELARDLGVVITRSADGALVYEFKGSETAGTGTNTLSTANGETIKLHLPDGSLVYLNAASSLSYLSTLNVDGERVVKLQGEGYFEVSKDKTHPFIVETERQRVKVMGTHFNINAYADAGVVSTTLLEGRILVSSLIGKRQSAILHPNQQSVLSGNSTLAVKAVDPANSIDWTSNDFAFNGVDFKTAMRKIARWYDLEIVYDPDLPEDIQPGGWISRKNNLSTVLQRIEAGGQVHFKIEGRRLRVTR